VQLLWQLILKMVRCFFAVRDLPFRESPTALRAYRKRCAKCIGQANGTSDEDPLSTTEVSDFVRVGGLAAVSAALPRALQGWADVRLVIPGYSQVLAGLLRSFTAFAGLPAVEVLFGRTVGGLPLYAASASLNYFRLPLGGAQLRRMALAPISCDDVCVRSIVELKAALRNFSSLSWLS
jgi:Starch synthase catalytic domain